MNKEDTTLQEALILEHINNENELDVPSAITRSMLREYIFSEEFECSEDSA